MPIFVIGIFALGLIIGISVIKENNANIINETSSKGKILYVGGSGPNNYTSIQDAINDANDGDTIFVYSGIYYENVVINKSITLVGEDKETTIIDGGYAGDVVRIVCEKVNISGFKIRCGNSGITASTNNNKICDCDVNNNRFEGIWFSFSHYNSIYDCEVCNNGGGIWLDYSNNNLIYNCDINNNGGKGIAVGCHASYNEIYNCNISNNSLEIANSCGTIINSCNFKNSGILIKGSSSFYMIHNISNNMVNGKPLLYYKNGNNIVLDGIEAGQIILANCNNFSVTNFSVSNTVSGIEILYCNNISICNCSLSNNEKGVFYWNSYNNKICNCNISNNGEGILII